MKFEEKFGKVGSWIGRKVDRVKEHVKRHKVAYGVGAATVLGIAAKAYIDNKNSNNDNAPMCIDDHYENDYDDQTDQDYSENDIEPDTMNE